MAHLIAVNQADIDQAMHGNPRFCPVAIALHRQGYTEPHVGRRSVTLRNGVTLNLPPAAINRIAAWDGDSQRPPVRIAPFSFEL